MDIAVSLSELVSYYSIATTASRGEYAWTSLRRETTTSQKDFRKVENALLALLPPEGVALALLVQIHVERLQFVDRDVVGEFLFENLGVLLGNLDPEFVAFLYLAAHRRAVDGDADPVAPPGLVDVLALLLDALYLADALGFVALEQRHVRVVLDGARDDLDADHRGVVLSEGVVGQNLEPGGTGDVLQHRLLLGLLYLLDVLLVLLDES